MARYHIICSNLSATACAPGGYQHVSHVGYQNAYGGAIVVTREQMVEILREPGNSAYTTGGGETAEVKVVRCDKCSKPFLRTEPDDTKADNLRKRTAGSSLRCGQTPRWRRFVAAVA
ncbi:MAG: DUF3892 domain-containing protein [Bradyrhizobium sp.]|uniref:DUF3892 domain-containing protein n=1 Tax=Bradyrhizobium sp. TaxID=376 RepID=UPI00345B7290|nr:DUF3892 domain-containing protein [Bradyrhizobium sp.]